MYTIHCILFIWWQDYLLGTGKVSLSLQTQTNIWKQKKKYISATHNETVETVMRQAK